MEKNDQFIVLHEGTVGTGNASVDILLLIYEDAFAARMQGELKGEAKLWKVRYAPRQFKKIEMVQSDTARLFYWNAKNGACLVTPKTEVKNWIRKLDVSENLRLVKEQKPETELTELYAVLNKINCHYSFSDQGFVKRESRFSCDWEMNEITSYYKENAFVIGERPVISISVQSHWETKEAWALLSQSISCERWEIHQLVDWINLLDTYDTIVEIKYMDEMGKEAVFSFRMDGGWLKWIRADGKCESIDEKFDVQMIGEKLREKMAERRHD